MPYDIAAELARLSQREDEQAAELKRSAIIREMPPLGTREFWIYWHGFTDGLIQARKWPR